MRSFCGCPHHLADTLEDTALPRWQERHLRWCALGVLPGLTVAETVGTYAGALDAWCAVCLLSHEQTDQPSEAHLLLAVGRIDGPRGVLAWSELPEAGLQVRQRYDVAEAWTTSIDPAVVAAHEIGHALGLGHGPAGALMAPVYDPAVRGPQAWDVAEAVRRYGRRLPLDSLATVGSGADRGQKDG